MPKVGSVLVMLIVLVDDGGVSKKEWQALGMSKNKDKKAKDKQLLQPNSAGVSEPTALLVEIYTPWLLVALVIEF